MRRTTRNYVNNAEFLESIIAHKKASLFVCNN